MKSLEKFTLFNCKKSSAETTRELIITQAKKMFAERGYEGTSLREICSAANANVSAVKYHFGDKESLYKTCLSEYAESRFAVITRILTPAKTTEELKIKLKLFAEDYLNESFLNFDMTRMIFREIENMNSIMEGIFEGTFLKFYKQIELILSDAQSKNLISKDINIEATTGIFFHYLTHSVKCQHISKKFFNKDLQNSATQKQHIDNLIDILFNGINPLERL